jgi:fucose permease
VIDAIMRTRPPLALLTLAFVAFVSLGLPDGVLGVAWPSMRHDLRVQVGHLGWLLIASMIGYLSSSFLSGWLVARLGLGRLLVASSAMILGVLIVFAVGPRWWLIAGVAVISGLGGGAIDAAINAHAAARFSPMVINWLHACYGIGATIGPALMTTVLATGQSWRWGYALLAAVIAAMTVAFVATRRAWDADGSPGAGPLRTPSIAPVALPVALRRRGVWAGALWFFLYTGIEVTAGQWSYTLLTEQRGVDTRTAGVAISAYWACLTIGRITFGLAAARFRPGLLLRLTTLLLPLCACVFWLNGGVSASMVSLAAMGFLLAPMFPLMVAMTPDRVGRDCATHAIGFQIAAAALGAAMIPAACGALAQTRGLAAIGPYLLAICLALLAIYAMTHMASENRRPTVVIAEVPAS